MNDLPSLLARREDICRLVESSTGLGTDHQTLAVSLAHVLDQVAARLEPLADANTERQERVRTAIQRAANEFLTQRIRETYAPLRWTGLLRDKLARRYERFGLDRLPCDRTIRAALKNWTPPNGGARKV